MTDLITIFIDGGEYVNRAAYIEQRDEASKLRERIEELEAALRLISNPGDVTDAEELGYIAREALEDRE